MQSVDFEGHAVFLYRSMLFTRSPLLKEIYCESHRLEPWAVHGDPRRAGRYVFPCVLYVERGARDALRASIVTSLQERSDFTDLVVARFAAAVRAALGHIRQLRRGHRDRACVDVVVEDAARVLSAGIFKEVLEPTDAMGLLSRYMPIADIAPCVLALYQPRCLPHFLKFELRVLSFCERYARRRDPADVARCVARAAHHSRFLLEETELHDPAAMRARMEAVIDDAGGQDGVRARRRALLARHESALLDSLLAERDILQHLAHAGRYQLRTKLLVMNVLRMIQFIATIEELKHVVAIEAAQALRQTIEALGLRVDEVTREALVRAADTPLAALDPTRFSPRTGVSRS